MCRQRRSYLILSLTLALTLGIIIVRVTMGYQDVLGPAAPRNTVDEPRRETSGTPGSPDLSFIDSASATCSRPAAGTGACYIEWNYLYVTADSGSYVISMTVSIDGRLRAYHSGFFQSYMYIPDSMTPKGYKVTCGLPGSGGKAAWGHSYPYTIRARDSAGLTAANFGTVTCPADVVKLFLPVALRS